MVEKIVLVSLLIISGVGATRYVFPLPMASVFITSTLVLYLVLCIWYMAIGKLSFRTLVYFFFLVQTFGIWFKLFHWPGVGLMLFVGAFNYVLLPMVLILSAFQKTSNTGQRILYLLISALFILPVFFTLINVQLGSVTAILSLVLLLNFILASKFMKQFGVQKEDSRTLTLTGFQVLFVLIAKLGALIREGEYEQNLLQQF